MNFTNLELPLIKNKGEVRSFLKSNLKRKILKSAYLCPITTVSQLSITFRCFLTNEYKELIETHDVFFEFVNRIHMGALYEIQKK